MKPVAPTLNPKTLNPEPRGQYLKTIAPDCSGICSRVAVSSHQGVLQVCDFSQKALLRCYCPLTRPGYAASAFESTSLGRKLRYHAIDKMSTLPYLSNLVERFVARFGLNILIGIPRGGRGQSPEVSVLGFRGVRGFLKGLSCLGAHWNLAEQHTLNPIPCVLERSASQN